MARIVFDPAVDAFHLEVLDPHITLKPKDANDFGPIMRSRENLSEGDSILAGTYLVQVERGHGYTRRKLFEEASFQIGEMLEIIFDTDTTNEEHDREAYNNIVRLLECRFPPEVKERLVKKCVNTFKGVSGPWGKNAAMGRV